MGAVGSRGRSQQSIPQVVVKLLLVFAVCTVLTAYLASTIGNINLFEHTYKLSATFDDANGLLRADNVKVAGVVVGKVGSVKIDQGRAKVQFSLKDSVNRNRSRRPKGRPPGPMPSTSCWRGRSPAS